jgi:hypothetical protein
MDISRRDTLQGRKISSPLDEVISEQTQRYLFYYYLVKRIFLLLDEWGFYVIMYYLVKTKHYKSFIAVLVYGVGCIYTSYNNITKIERRLFDEEQDFYAISWNDMRRFLSI